MTFLTKKKKYPVEHKRLSFLTDIKLLQLLLLLFNKVINML